MKWPVSNIQQRLKAIFHAFHANIAQWWMEVIHLNMDELVTKCMFWFQVVENELHVDSEDKPRPGLCVSSTGTNATCMLPDSTKDNIPSSTNVEPLTIATTAKIPGTSQSSPASTGSGAATKPSAAKRSSSMSPTSTAPASSSAKSSGSTVSSTVMTTAAPIMKTCGNMEASSQIQIPNVPPH